MAQTAAQLADRPEPVRALTKIFLAEIARLLCAAAGEILSPKVATFREGRSGAGTNPARVGPNPPRAGMWYSFASAARRAAVLGPDCKEPTANTP